MINKLQLIRNIGRFDSVATAAAIPLSKLTLIYAENGRGKTTLAAILRSLATGEPLPILERHRLASTNPPHVVIDCAGGPPPAMFNNGAWNRTLDDVSIFDDTFIDKNVFSGLAVGVDQRQNLHELILGAQGISLNKQLQDCIEQIEQHNAELRLRGAAISTSLRGNYTVDEFCSLKPNPDIVQAIEEAERNLAAAREQEPVRNTPTFEPLSLPEISLQETRVLLEANIENLNARAAARVQEHLATVGPAGEEWVSQGVRLQSDRRAELKDTCLFCAQDLSASPVFQHYSAYFSEAYRELQSRIHEAAISFRGEHDDDVSTRLERGFRLLQERYGFWSRFVKIRPLHLDSEAVIRDWRLARDAVIALLRQKRSNPLDVIEIPKTTEELVQKHADNILILERFNHDLKQQNEMIEQVRARTAKANAGMIDLELTRLRAIASRQEPTIVALCDAFTQEAARKGVTEVKRDALKDQLESYRRGVFPKYQASINRFLSLFNAGFHIENINAANTRSGPACTYSVVINNTPIAVTGSTPQAGTPSFRNTLSAGDRNALALAFFFASVELDANATMRTVVIDDPVSSLDEHRALTTVQEIRRLATRVSQVIVLSHSKLFLCNIWENADKSCRAALHVVRHQNGSTIEAWDVDNDSITEHDRRSELLRNHLLSSGGNGREVAQAIRPHLEAFCRVAYPADYPPGTLLGPFRGMCEQRVSTSQQILRRADIDELRDLTEYGNRFHHDTNPALASEVINDAQLTGFVRRLLEFVRRP